MYNIVYMLYIYTLINIYNNTQIFITFNLYSLQNFRNTAVMKKMKCSLRQHIY